jgi:hypothetical protein
LTCTKLVPMRFVKKIKKIEAQRLRAGMLVHHPLLGNQDGIVVTPPVNPLAAKNEKKVYVRTRCGRIYTFCPNSLTKIDVGQVAEEIIIL